MDKDISIELLPGESEFITETLDISEVKSATDVNVKITVESDIDDTDNSQTVKIGHVDVALDVNAYVQGDQYLFVITTANNSLTDANATLTISEDNSDGKVMYSKEFETISRGNAVQHTYAVDKSEIDFADAVYSILSGDYSNIGRFLTISLNSSSFVGRLIYYKDALLEIIKHPLGLGYMGYYYTQGSFQSAVYSVMFVHNEFLQLLLDVGWIPAGLCFYAFIKSIVANKNDKTKLILMLVFSLHFMVDFDGQFVSILLILMLLMDIREGKKYELKNNIAVIASTAVVSFVCVFIGLSCFFQHMNNPELALKFYPLNTTAKIDLLMQADTPEEMDKLADSILKQNKSVSIAYSAKAKVAFSKGDFATLIENKLKAIELARYSIEEYKDFDYMLTIGTDLYRKAGDRESAAYCMELRNSIPDMLEALKEETSPLAYKIDDKPIFEFD